MPLRLTPTALLVLLLLVGALLAGAARAGAEKARVLHSLRPLYGEAASPVSFAAWDAGWRDLCEASRSPRVYLPSEPSARGIAALAALQFGDLPALRELVAGADVDRVPNGVAYDRMLHGDWLGAAQAYDGTTGPALGRLWGTVLFLAGQAAYDAGDVPLAGRLLFRAEELYGQDGPYSSPSLAQCLDQWGRHAEAQRELRRAAAVLPPDASIRQLQPAFLPNAAGRPDLEWLPAQAVRPAYSVSLTVPVDWTVLGADVDQDDLRRSPLLRVTTYWRTPRVPERVAAVHSVVRNLVANGALEWDYAPAGVRPFGYFQLVYPQPPQVSLATETGGRRALCLSSPPGTGTGVQGLSFPLATTDGTIIIQGGDVVSREGGYFAVGRRWYGGAAQSPYSYVASAPAGSTPADWTTFVGAATLEPGAQSVALWLLHRGDGGTTCYANLFMFELPSAPVTPPA